MQNYHHYGLLVCFIANIIYELFATYLPIDPNTYRLELYRYTFLIAFGCYVGLNGVLNKFVSVALAVLGVFFTYLICYRGNNLFLQEGWAGTSLLPSLMIFPIFYWVRKLQLRCKPLELIGKASYHIFLVQMVYFQFSSIIYPMMKRRALQTPVSIVVCILVGIAFYCIEKPITKLVVRAYRKMISLIDADVQNS